MSTPQNALPHQSVPWLFAAALSSTVPHIGHLPIWLSLFATGLWLWAGWLWSGNRRLPGHWPLAVIVATALGGMFYEFHTLLGRDAGVAFLVLLMAMKQLEMRSRRDALVVINLGYFLLLTHYFYSQSIFTGAWLLLSIWVLTAALIKISAEGQLNTRFVLRQAALIGAQALPFMVALFLLFPRVSGPLWGLPKDAHSSTTGLSEQMTPGNIAELVQSGEIAFRVRFDGEPPAPDKRYWRGPVLENFDGRTWTQRSPRRGARLEITPLGPTLTYESTLEASQQKWLLALDAPISLPPDSNFNSGMAVISGVPLDNRQRFRFASTLDYRMNVRESAQVLQDNLRLPPNTNPRARALAESWQQQLPPDAIIKQALTMFNRDFYYTLEPPLMGVNGVDEFLFENKQGFCEHFASAFVVLMRAAGIPARIVAGYQGGELNPLDGYLVVRQSDAHAWAEVWLPEQGWRRVDPTSAVAPNRIQRGIVAALPANAPLPALIQAQGEWLRALRYRWEALNNQWNQQVLGYDTKRQRDLLSHLGVTDADWRSMVQLLAAFCSIIAIALLAWALYHRPMIDPLQRLWLEALRKLRRSKVDCAPWETPLALAARVEVTHPELAAPVRQLVSSYLLARYGAKPTDLTALRAAVARLP